MARSAESVPFKLCGFRLQIIYFLLMRVHEYGTRKTAESQRQTLCAPPCPNPAFTFNTANNHISGFTYDAAGNVTADGLHTYQWDAEGRLTLIDSGGANPIHISFNALGRRASRNWPSGDVTGYWYNPGGEYLGGYWALGSVWNAEVPFAGRMLAEYTSNTTGPVYFDHPNALGSAGAWTGGAGNSNGEVQFYPWGYKWGDTTNGSVFQVYASLLWYDPETDGYHTPARYYIPRHSRWLTPDPIGVKAVKLDDPQTWNMYAYARNNPTTLTDPSGLEERKNPCAEGNSECYARWLRSGKGWTKTSINLHTNAGTVHLTVYTRAGTDWGGKGVTIYAQPDNCANCGWVQTVKPQNTFKLLGDFGEHTDWTKGASASERYPVPVLSTGRSMDELYDSPGIGEGGKQFVSTLGTVQQGSSSFGVLGSLSWGAGLVNGGVNVQTPIQATPAQQSTSLGMIGMENPTINIQPVQ